jgi:multiple sugar transport system substrate-binding protein
VIDWKDMTDKPYLMEILGSGILKDMVMEVAIEGVAPEKAAAKAQQRAEELIKDKGYAKW